MAIPQPEPGRARAGERRLLQGDVPNPITPPSGCRFRTRCPHAQQRCADEVPLLSAEPGEPGHRVACHFWRDITLPAALQPAQAPPGVNRRLEVLQAAFLPKTIDHV